MLPRPLTEFSIENCLESSLLEITNNIVVRFLLNLYTSQQAHVLWNGHFSQWFGIKNGVKRGGVITYIHLLAT